MNIKQIKYFIAVAEQGSLSAAAKLQFVTVQAVSKAIADLEHELGRGLFVRESRGVHPTPFGLAFYQKARPALQSFEQLEHFAQGSKEQVAIDSVLHLALCTPPFIGYERALHNIEQFARRSLGMGTSVVLERDTNGIDDVLPGDLDGMVTVGMLSHPNLDCEAVGTISPALMMPPDHPLAQKKAIRLSDLEPYPVATARNFKFFSNSIMSAYGSRGLNVTWINGSSEEVADLFQRGGVVFAAGIEALANMGGKSVMRFFVPSDSVAIPICMVGPRKHKSPAFLAFEQLLAGGSTTVLRGHSSESDIKANQWLGHALGHFGE